MQDRIDHFIVERIEAGTKDLYEDVLAWMERFLIVYTLRLTKGNQTQAAELLGITRGSLRFKLRARGIRIGQIVASPHGAAGSAAHSNSTSPPNEDQP